MPIQTFSLTCSDCKTKIKVDAPTKQSAIDTARVYKWAVSRDRKICYCPNCAPLHRNVGCYGGKRSGIQQRIEV